ncbi:MAG TPA: VanZ family protein [Coleofasciculaceae cyanobacterium]|jgi:VanZ family protein
MSIKKRHQRRGYLLLIASLSAICVATIFPFKFVIPPGFSGRFVIEEFNFGSNVKDYLQNILLFIPFGISLAFIVDRPQRNTAIILIVGLSGAMVSTAIELTQFFLPIRVSNLTDIIYNSLGATLGGILYCWRSDIIQLAIGIIKGDRRKLSLKSLLVAIFSYCSIVILGVWILLINVNLSNWNEDFPLVIGNEATGDRPWNGYINNLYICDRSLSKFEVEKAFEQADAFFPQLSSLVTVFNFDNPQNYYLDNSHHVAKLLWQSPDSSPTNHQDILSNLSKHQESANNLIPQKLGVLVNSKQWLKTAQPATFLTEKLKKTDELTLFLTISTNDINQDGPARILALSDGIYTQNLIIGQEKTGLNFRLRTPITGSNATQPEFIIPKVFDTNNFHQILITFVNNQLNFYVDNFERKYSFKFTPAITFLVCFPWQKQNWKINLKEFDIIRYQQLFYTMIFVPFILLASVLVYYLAANKSVFK